MLREDEARAQALAEAGWTRRFIADPSRCEEARALYESLGLEVHLESLAPAALYPECADCQIAACMTYRVIYTRPRTQSATPATLEAT